MSPVRKLTPSSSRASTASGTSSPTTPISKDSDAKVYNKCDRRKTDLTFSVNTAVTATLCLSILLVTTFPNVRLIYFTVFVCFCFFGKKMHQRDNSEMTVLIDV